MTAGGLALSTIIDLHTHTDVGSPDSTTTPADIAAVTRRIPTLHGLAFTEHVRRWPDEALAELPADRLFLNEREFDTYEGHIIVLGAPSVTRAESVAELRNLVLEAGGLMILAHPFRFYPSPLSLLYPRSWHEPGEWPPERLAEHQLFALVDAVEAWNYRATVAQNELAEACARFRGLPVVGGSDSHAPNDIGRFATEFDGDIPSVSEMIAAIRAGRCRAVALGAEGRYRPVAESRGASFGSIPA